MPLNCKIDLCRGLFAALVVVSHAFDVTATLHRSEFAGLPPVVLNLLNCTIGFGSGVYWVMGFFVISGYCIHLSVDRLLARDRFPLKIYVAARLTRILPLYYLALFFCVAVETWIAPARPEWWENGRTVPVLLSQLFLIQNLTETYGAFAPSWSITNELIYYAIYGLLACFAVRRVARPFWAGMTLCLAVSAAALLLDATGHRSRYFVSAGLLFGLGINWFLGVGVAVYSKRLLQSDWVCAGARAWPLPLIAAVVLRYDARCPTRVILALCGLAFALLLVRFLDRDDSNPAGDVDPWWARFSEVCGLASYPMYLFHGPVLLLLGSVLMRANQLNDWRVTWGMLSAAGILSGVALGVLAEAPIMAWRASYLRRLKKA